MKFFLLFFLICAFSAHAQPLTCSNYPGPEPFEPGVRPLAHLTPGAPFKIEVIFIQSYTGDGKTYPTDPWKEPQMRSVCEAARQLQTIWSSKDFQTELQKIQNLVLDAEKDGTVRAILTGPELMAKLLTSPGITLAVAVTSRRGVFGGCALSDPTSNQTALQSRYIINLKYRCGDEPPLLPPLTNTLAHEFTHYGLIHSTDGGSAGRYNPWYVSYGIGCLTQTIGYPDNRCNYEDPRTPPPHPIVVGQSAPQP